MPICNVKTKDYLGIIEKNSLTQCQRLNIELLPFVDSNLQNIGKYII